MPIHRRNQPVFGWLDWLIWAGALLGLVVLCFYAYRDLPVRPFAADDFQWLVSVRGLSIDQLLQQAFDPLAQRHFYRPMIWLLFAGQFWWFGLGADGYHAISLFLHLINALLLGGLALRWYERQLPTTPWQLLVVGFVPAVVLAFHPAPFEAIVWISAQSELFGAFLLLLVLHAWLANRPILATLLLAMAMLTKESAILGVPLLLVFAAGHPNTPKRHWYLLPGVLTLLFVFVQLRVGQENRVLREGFYGIGDHLLTNPLRSLALIIAPLSGTEHADATWLVPLGAVLALALLLFAGVAIWRSRSPSWNLLLRLLLALGFVLLPTAPFRSPPDSRYLYQPVAIAGMLVSLALVVLWQQPGIDRRLTAGTWLRRMIGVALLVGALGWSAEELSQREARFAAGAGPGGSLWRLTSQICSAEHPGVLVLVEPPLMTDHIHAIVDLACGTSARAVIVQRSELEAATRDHSVIIAFPGGAATIERWV
jgi:hypothetical protein